MSRRLRSLGSAGHRTARWNSETSWAHGNRGSLPGSGATTWARLDQAQTLPSSKHACDVGVTFFDTAFPYGDSDP